LHSIGIVFFPTFRTFEMGECAFRHRTEYNASCEKLETCSATEEINMRWKMSHHRVFAGKDTFKKCRIGCLVFLSQKRCVEMSRIQRLPRKFIWKENSK
jgi:hypothetical protein